MPQRAIHPPITIRSLEAAAKVIRRHAGDHLKAEDVLRQIKRATTLEQADAAGKAFREDGTAG